MLTVSILTISDKGARGQRYDESGQIIRDIFSKIEGEIVNYEIVPDERDIICQKLAEWAGSGDTDVIVTTGGTGPGERDVTPEATMAVVERVVPGLAEAMRAGSLSKTPMAMLSRAAAGIRDQCLIINLPGNPKAVRECLEIVLPVIPHAIDIIKGVVTEHS